MFDDLRESLGRFRSEVEESAEVDEEADEEETGEDDEPAEGAAAEEEQDQPAEEAGADETDDGGPAEDIEASDDEGEPAAEAGADGDEVVDGKPERGDTDDGEAEDKEASDAGDDGATAREGGPGFASRARSLATGKVYIDEEDLEGPLWDLEMALLGNDVAMPVAEDLLDRLRENLVGERRGLATRTGSVVRDAIHDALLEVLSVGQFDFDERVAAAERPVVIIFTGVNGVGKTTTIAKLARYLERRGLSSVLANGDTFRAGAEEQIAEHAERLGVPLIHHERGGDPAAVIYDAVEYADAHDVDVVLGDTAGRLHTSDDLMAQLEKIGRVVGPDMTLFVDEAVAGQDAVERAREFDAAAEIDGTVLTKADADSSGGAAISVAHVTGKPILFLGVGQEYDDLEPFDPEALVERLLEE